VARTSALRPKLNLGTTVRDRPRGIQVALLAQLLRSHALIRAQQRTGCGQSGLFRVRMQLRNAEVESLRHRLEPIRRVAHPSPRRAQLTLFVRSLLAYVRSRLQA
jgi:hypothetical protein